MKTLLEMESTVNSVGLLFLMAAFVKLYRVLVAKPAKLRASLRQQGVPGPIAHVLLGNIWEVKDMWAKAKAEAEAEGRITGPDKISYHDCEAAVFPFTKKWREECGDVFTFALGTTQIFYAGGAEMVKEIATYTSLDLGKPSNQHTSTGPLLGHGILTSDGESWARQRKIIAPEFYSDKVKGMVNLVNESAQALIQTWKEVIDGNGGNAEIEIDEDMRSFSGVVISKACFGSNYKQGEAIFGKIRQLELLLAKSPLVNNWVVLTMVIHETLRLCPPSRIIAREALKDIKIGGFHIPQSVNVWTMITSLHTDPKAWGPDSYSFNPAWFANGVASACKYPHFYMPFGVGPRICLGQNLAMVELKTLLCSIVTNFSFSLSPKYVHSPHFNMIMEPQHGVPLLIKRL